MQEHVYQTSNSLAALRQHLIADRPLMHELKDSEQLARIEKLETEPELRETDGS